MPLTCFGLSCGYPQGGSLQSIYYKNFVNQCINIRYEVLKVWFGIYIYIYNDTKIYSKYPPTHIYFLHFRVVTYNIIAA